MGTYLLHIFKAERNEAFYKDNKLESSKYTEWAIITLFYICMHYVDAVLCNDVSLNENERDPQSHFERAIVMAKCIALSQIYDKYKNLYNRSRDARYYKVDFTPKRFSYICADYYLPLRKHLRNCLKLS